MAIKWCRRGCETKKGYWITREDINHKISTMTTQHLKNAIDYIKVHGGALRDFELDKIDELVNELRGRKENEIEEELI